MTDLQKLAVEVTATLVAGSVSPNNTPSKQLGKAIADTYKGAYNGIYDFLKSLEENQLP